MKLRKLDSKLLMLSLALPGAAHALGLGDIHISSALGDPLVGRIDIIGASPQELAGLRAVIASDAVFHRFGVDRPRFLETTALKLGKDRQGRPIILLSSQQPVVEPLVNLLVDLQSTDGELVREYTVLLDPPGFGAEPRERHRAQARARVTPARVTASRRRSSSKRPQPTRAALSRATPIITTYTVSPQDTLSRIVRLAGAKSMADERRMMIAVFHDNPGAFAGNLNFLRAGATLHLPTPAEVAAIGPGVAKREFAAQMQAWRVARHPLLQPVTPVTPVTPVAQVAQVAQVAPAATIAELNRQIASLQQSIAAVRSQLQQPLVLPALAQAPTRPAMQTSAPAAAVRAWQLRFAPLAAGAALGLAALAALLSRWRARRPRALPAVATQERADLPEEAAIAPEAPAVGNADSASSAESIAYPESTEQRVSAEPGVATAQRVSTDHRVASGDTTVQLAPPVSEFNEITSILERPAGLSEETAEQLLRAFDPEHAINTTHVRLSSALHEQREFVERRKNPADVLRQAIEREPERSDLRLKLLELYYTAAAENRRAFLEVARRLTNKNGLVSAEEWARIASMGREIAADDTLFAGVDVAEDDIADCA